MNPETLVKYVPLESETERASNSYLMSLVAAMGGLPLPIFNLIATVIFYLGNRKSTYFVRWHCTQALLSQFSMLAMNSAGFWWTVGLIVGHDEISSRYIAYIITIVFFNIVEFIATIYTAIKVRQGKHVAWWLYGDLTDLVCKH